MKIKQDIKILKLNSIKVGFFLLVVVTLLSLTFSFFPDKEISGFSKFLVAFSIASQTQPGATLSFQPRFESPLFLTLVAFLSLTLATSVYARIKAEIHRRRRQSPSLPGGTSTLDRNDVLKTILGILEQHRYAPCVAPSTKGLAITAEKGTSGILGSALFHSSLLIIIIGATISTLGSFRASVALTEGQTFDSERDDYGYVDAGTFYTPPSQHLNLRLDEVDPDYEINGASTIVSFISGPDSRKIPVFVNHQGFLAGREIHFGRKIGFSPALSISQNGKILFEGFLRLASFYEHEAVYHRDLFELPDGKSRVVFEFLPDAVFRNGQFTSRSEKLTNPVLGVSMTDGTTRSETQWIPIGGSAQLGDLVITFPDIRRWSQIDVVDDPGKNVMLIGVILGSIGLALRLFSVRKRLTVQLTSFQGKVSVEVNGSSEKFPAEFRSELASLRVALQLALLEAEQDSGMRDAKEMTDAEKFSSEKAFEEVSS